MSNMTSNEITCPSAACKEGANLELFNPMDMCLS
jgi:hypothetical protein